MVSTGWDNSPHFSTCDGDFEGDVPRHLISLRGDIGWPAHSPDLNSCDFFLWGYLKLKVSSNRPQSIEQLKDAIRQEIIAIPQEMICRVKDNFRERFRQWVNNNGSHLTDLIAKTY